VRHLHIGLTLALALALIAAPLAGLIAANDCGLPGVPEARAKNCHGCCVKMACCVDTKRDKAQPVQNAECRTDAGVAAVVAVRVARSLFTPATGRSAYRPVAQSAAVPVFSSIDRLCVRLI